MHELLNRDGGFTKMFVVQYGFGDEAPITKHFITEKAALEFAESVRACLQDVYVEYKQKHSILAISPATLKI